MRVTLETVHFPSRYEVVVRQGGREVSRHPNWGEALEAAERLEEHN